MGEAEKALGRLSAAQAAQARGSADVASSAAAASRALGYLTPQLGDLVSQISAGGAPVTAFIQQGMQLRDVFANDATALQGLKLLITPTTVGLGAMAAAGAAVAVAYAQGSAEADAYRKALVMTGGAAGTSTDALAEMARQAAATTGTVHANAAALAALAGTGRVGAGQLLEASAAAVAMERELGISVAETARTFADLGREPVKASLRLNDSLHYLTATTYEQIKSLEEQGRVAEAAAVAQEAYAKAMAQRADQLKGSLGYLERAARGVADAFASMWDKALNIGRADTLEQKLEKARDKLTQMQRSGGGAWAYNGGDYKQGLEAAQYTVQALEEQVRLRNQSAAKTAEEAMRQQAFAKATEEGTQYLDRQARMAEEITRKRNEWTAAGLAQEEIEKRISVIRQNYDSGVNIVELHNAEAVQLERIQGVQQAINSQRAQGYISEREAIERRAALELQALGVRAAAVQGELAIAKAKRDSYAQVAQMEGQLAVIAQQRINTQKQAERDLDAERKGRVFSALQAEQALRDEDAAVRRAVFERDMAAQAQVERSLYQSNQELDHQLDLNRAGLSLLGATNEQRSLAIERLNIEFRLKQKIAEIDSMSGAFIDDDWKERQRENARQQAIKEAAAAEGRIYLVEWQRTTDQIGQSLSDALMNGGKSAAEYLKGLFRSTVLRPIIQGVVQPLVGSVASAFSPSGSSGGGMGAAGYVNTASSAYSLYNGASSAWTLGSQYAAGTMSAANVGGTMWANTTGGGLDALLATNGAYGTAAGASGAAAGGGAAAAGEGAAAGSAAAGSAGSGAAGAMSTMASYIPYVAIAMAILNAAGVFRTTRQVGGGLLGTVGDINSIQAYGLMRKSGTLFRGPDYSYTTTDADPAAVKAISNSVASMLAATRAQAATLGAGANIASFSSVLGTDVIHPDTGGVGIKLDGLTAEQAQAKITEAMSALSERMAQQVLGRFETTTTYANARLAALGIGGKTVESYVGSGYERDGETAVQTLTRLSSALHTVNASFDVLGHALLSASLSSGDLASSLIDTFGSADAMTGALGAYYDAIYSDSEKLATSQRRLSSAFADLGLAVPANSEAYRKLVDAQDLTTAAGRSMYAHLIQLAPLFGQVRDAVSRLGDGLAEEVARLRGLNSDGSAQSTAALMARFATATAAARAGDATAAGQLTGLSQSLESAALAGAGSAADYARMRAWLANSLSATLAAAGVVPSTSAAAAAADTLPELQAAWAHLITVPAFAAGGLHRGGLRLVGERGPELEVTGPARYYSASQTQQILSGGGNAELLAALIKRVDALQVELVGLRAEQRLQAAAQIRQQRRSADVLEAVAEDGTALAVRVVTPEETV